MEIGLPNSVISSSNLAACVIQINIDNDREINKKSFINSKKKYLNILCLTILSVLTFF